MILVLPYLLGFLYVFYWALRIGFGRKRAGQLTIFVPSAMLLIGMATILGLMTSTIFMNEEEYRAYWHSFELPSFLTQRLIDNAGTLSDFI